MTTEQFLQLRDRRLDVGLLRLPVGGQEQVETTVLHQEPFVLLLPAAHPLSRKRSLRIEDLRGADFVIYTRKHAPAFHDLILHILNDAGVNPHVVQEASEMHTLVSLVAAGLGVALAPQSIHLLHRHPGVVARKLPATLPLSEIALAVRKGDTSPTVQLFVKLALAGRDKSGRSRVGVRICQ